jgi:ADP-ribosylation factor-like protein 1
LGGQSSIRPYWRCYYPNTNAVVYVIDSIDRDRIEITKREMMTMLSEADLIGVPLLILANKQDLPGAMTEVELTEALGLTNLRDRHWNIFKTCAIRKDGLTESFDWLCNILSDSKP